MNFVEIIYYVCLTAPLVWLAWLATRQFEADASRLTLVVFGLALYGFFMSAIVVPVTNIHSAHVTAVQQMFEWTGSPGNVSFSLTVQSVCLLGFSLVAVILLLRWLQRSLARVPRLARVHGRTQAKNTQQLV